MITFTLSMFGLVLCFYVLPGHKEAAAQSRHRKRHIRGHMIQALWSIRAACARCLSLRSCGVGEVNRRCPARALQLCALLLHYTGTSALGQRCEWLMQQADKKKKKVAQRNGVILVKNAGPRDAPQAFCSVVTVQTVFFGGCLMAR